MKILNSEVMKVKKETSENYFQPCFNVYSEKASNFIA